jgi:hypothetical protein
MVFDRCAWVDTNTEATQIVIKSEVSFVAGLLVSDLFDGGRCKFHADDLNEYPMSTQHTGNARERLGMLSHYLSMHINGMRLVGMPGNYGN